MFTLVRLYVRYQPSHKPPNEFLSEDEFRVNLELKALPQQHKLTPKERRQSFHHIVQLEPRSCPSFGQILVGVAQSFTGCAAPNLVALLGAWCKIGPFQLETEKTVKVIAC